MAHALADQLAVDADQPDAAAKDARAADILTAVWANANTTLTAIRQTATALEAVEHAAEAIEKSKGLENDMVSRHLCAGAICACTTLRLGLTCVPTPQQGACRHAEEGPSAPAGQAAGHRSHAGGHSSRGRGGRQGGVHAVHPQPSAGEPQLAVQLLSARAIIEFRAQSWS